MVSKFKLDSAKNIETKEAISRTLEIANSYAGELAIEVIPLDKIELDPDNKRDLLLTLSDAVNGINSTDPHLERKKEDWKSLESLAKTIQNDQLINPIFVYRYGNKCRLIAGERRTLASAIAGKKEIIARIASQRPIGTRLKILQWVENNERSELGLAERISSLEAILAEYFLERKENTDMNKITSRILSDLTGISITQSRRYLLILQCLPEIRTAINEAKLENIKLIELICSAKCKEQQLELLSKAITGSSFEAIVKIKKEMDAQLSKKIEKRSKKRNNVRLRNVSPNIAKIIISSLLLNSLFEEEIVKQIQIISKNILWENNESIEKAFKKIAILIEQGDSTIK